MTRGQLITFEGIDGCGKTTQLRLLARYLSSQGIAVVTTREPGGTNLGKTVRAALLDSPPGSVEPLAELLLYSADRAQHVRELVLPALEAGKIVLSDRFYDATTAYQGYGRGFDRQLIDSLNSLATGGLTPDLTLLFDLEVAAGLQRVQRRSVPGAVESGAQPDRLDLEPLHFHERVRQGYFAIAAREPARFRIIPAAGTIEEISPVVIATVENFLKTDA